MIEFVKATTKDFKLLSNLSKQTFLESHGNSAPKKDVANFIHKTYNEAAYLDELENSENIYHILYFNNEIAGYSKIVLNSPNKNVANKNITKLDRFYLLKKFYGKQLGKTLLNFIIEIAKNNHQQGLWLAVWIENLKGIQFYKKTGFKPVGVYDFKLSETHANPNHIMYLKL